MDRKTQGHDQQDHSQENETRRLLRTLLRDAVPPVPRKLNRTGELYSLYLDAAAARPNQWAMEKREERLTLLRLVILQLLAPDLFRFGRNNKTFLSRMEQWANTDGNVVDLNQLEAELRKKNREDKEQLKTNPDNQQVESDLYFRSRVDLPLITLVRRAQQHRSGFDPMKLFHKSYPSETDLQRYFNLENPQPTVTPATAQAVKSSPARVARVDSHLQKGEPADAHPVTSPSDFDGFFRQLFSSDETAWRNALEQETSNLYGHVLDERSFNTLLDYIHRSDKDFVQQHWIEMLEPYLTASQLFAVYRESRLLQRLNQQLPQA